MYMDKPGTAIPGLDDQVPNAGLAPWTTVFPVSEVRSAGNAALHSVEAPRSRMPAVLGPELRVATTVVQALRHVSAYLGSSCLHDGKKAPRVTRALAAPAGMCVEFTRLTRQDPMNREVV